MKILIVHKYHYYRAGAETQKFKQSEILQSEGHDVMHFSMHHPDNLTYKYDNFFVPHMDLMDELGKGTIRSKIKVILKMYYSRIARRKFAEALDFFNPQVIHLHNIHKHLTISILLEAKKRNIPVVWTLHDYQLICPNYTLLSRGRICEKCKNHRYWAPLIERCAKDSFQASIASAVEKLFYDLAGIDNLVSAYISPSKFLKNKFYEFKFTDKKIYYLPNCFEVNKNNSTDYLDKYFFYLGRISEEKGISTLCKAVQGLDIKIKIAGTGPQLDYLTNKYSSSKIKFLGYKTGEELENLRSNAWFTIVPSEWYENNPFSIIESFSDGVPVIGSDVGGIPELVSNHTTGFLFKMKNIDDLKKTILKADALSMAERNALSENCVSFISTAYSPKTYYENLLSVYYKVINK